PQFTKRGRRESHSLRHIFQQLASAALTTQTNWPLGHLPWLWGVPRRACKCADPRDGGLPIGTPCQRVTFPNLSPKSPPISVAPVSFTGSTWSETLKSGGPSICLSELRVTIYWKDRSSVSVTHTSRGKSFSRQDAVRWPVSRVEIQGVKICDSWFFLT